MFFSSLLFFAPGAFFPRLMFWQLELHKIRGGRRVCAWRGLSIQHPFGNTNIRTSKSATHTIRLTIIILVFVAVKRLITINVVYKYTNSVFLLENLINNFFK